MELNEAIIELNKNGFMVLNEYKITPEFDELSADDKVAFGKLMNRYYDSVKIKDPDKKKARLKEVGKSLKEYLKKVKNKTAKAKIQKAIDFCKAGTTGESKPAAKPTNTKTPKATKVKAPKALKPKEVFDNDVENYGCFVLTMKYEDKELKKNRNTYWKVLPDSQLWNDSLTKAQRDGILKNGHIKINIDNLKKDASKDKTKKYSNTLELISCENAMKAFGEKGWDNLKSEIVQNVMKKTNDVNALPSFVRYKAPKASTPGWPSGPEDLDKYGYFFTAEYKRREDIGNPEKLSSSYFYVVTDDDWDRMSEWKKKELLVYGYYSDEHRYSYYSRETYYCAVINADQAKKMKNGDGIPGVDATRGYDFEKWIIMFAKNGFMKEIPPEIETKIGKKKIVNYTGPKEITGPKFTLDEPYFIVKQWSSGYSQYWGSRVPESTDYKCYSPVEMKKYIDSLKDTEKKEEFLNGGKYTWYHEASAGCGSSNGYSIFVRYSDVPDDKKKSVAKQLLGLWKNHKITALPDALQKYARKVEEGQHELKIINRRLSCSYTYGKDEKPYNAVCRAYSEISKYIDDYVKSKYGKFYDVIEACGCREGSDSEDEDYYWFDAYYPEELDEYILKRFKYYEDNYYWVEISYRGGSKTIKY